MKMFDVELSSVVGGPLKLSLLAIALVVTGFGIFLCGVPVPSTVIASGKITTLRATREISHDRGGIIKSVRVLVGDSVTQGQPILELDQSTLKAELTALSTEIVILSAERESLHSESLPEAQSGYSAVLKALAEDYGLEESLIQEVERGRSKENARSNLIAQTESERENLRTQLANTTSEHRAKQEELGLVTDLVLRKEKLQEEGFATAVDVGNLKIQEARLRGAIHRLKARINQLRGAIKKNKLDAERLPDEENFERLTRIAQLSREIAERKSQREVLLEAVSHSVVKAPIAGQVIDLSVNTIGGFLPAGQPIVSIAPENEHMLIEARLMPREVHSVSPGMKAKIVFPTFPQREMVELKAEIESIATDVISDERTGERYYLARLKIPQSIFETAMKNRTRKVYAGLPVDVYVTIDRMTIIDYLLKPLRRSMRQTFRA